LDAVTKLLQMKLLLIVIIPFFLAVALGRIIIPFIIMVTFRKRLFDPVDKRKVHQGIIPRLGGVSFAPVQCCLLTLGIVFIYKLNYMDHISNASFIMPMFLLLVCGLVMLFIVGIADDLVGVNYKPKFLVQILAACLFPISGLWINDMYGVLFITYLPPWIGMPLTVFVVVLIINAVNLIDGIDGLCSGLVMVGCLILGGLFAVQSAWLHAIFAFITAGVLVPFFYYNVFGASRRRHRIFMGDTGSLTLGLSISFLAISFAMNNQLIKPFSEGAIVVALDVARVILVRYKAGKPLFMPDRNHIHHKFLKTGMSHHAAMIFILLLALFFCMFNVILVEYISNNIVLLLDVILWCVFHLIFDKIEKEKKRDLGLSSAKRVVEAKFETETVR
jgi:UDP-N-acetylmuramyl pentapeptide phosphotransferase/UDP-N-acetylglucosamine-1-phosphate transferase